MGAQVNSRSRSHAPPADRQTIRHSLNSTGKLHGPLLRGLRRHRPAQRDDAVLRGDVDSGAASQFFRAQLCLYRVLIRAPRRDLLNHRCIRFRHRGESAYKWELDKGQESLAIAVNGSLILDELDLEIQAALDGAGLAWVADDRVMQKPQPTPNGVSAYTSPASAVT